ncbi:hypothetical protein BIW11_09379 [Tropilaelaps mercedesae]|uniref:Uncharacterized protein n=1 Tax=Tropilaelaps mercedesae TaxID=418985 RepID=A0A1V9XKF3_9ACAR|nr:hypothetical protein BIW11_09379 [Tropilaelaps mercedesae]
MRNFADIHRLPWLCRAKMHALTSLAYMANANSASLLERIQNRSKEEVRLIRIGGSRQSKSEVAQSTTESTGTVLETPTSFSEPS